MSLRAYADLAQWWPLFSPVEDYAEEAAVYCKVLLAHSRATPTTLLELGSGGGHNAFHLKGTFDMTLVDLSADMVRQSQNLNPELSHHVGDMRSVRLGRIFDAVFVHDAVSYMTTRDDLERACATAFAHCRPGGVALFAPDETRETFEPETSCGGSDEGARGFRYLEWCWDPDETDETIATEYAFVIREADGTTRVEHERHVHGLFPRQVWLDTLTRVGFDARSEVHQHSELPAGHELFIGVKPPQR